MRRQNASLVMTTPHVQGDEDIGELVDIVGFHIRLAHGTVNRHFSEIFADLNLTQKQVSVLWLVDDHDDISQTDLATFMRMDRATTMAIVNRLQDRNFLIRKKSKTDGRKQTLHLTKDGAEALVVAKSAIAYHEDWLKSRFTKVEVTRLIEMLTRIHE